MIKEIRVTNDYKEMIEYDDPSFPVEICIDDYECFYNNTLNTHWHNEIEFGIVIAGEVDFTVNNKKLNLKKNDCMLINANILHSAVQHKGVHNSKMFIAAFSPLLFSNDINSSLYTKHFTPFLESDFECCIFSNEEIYTEEIKQKLLDLYNLERNEVGYELRCISVLSELWVLIMMNMEDIQRKAIVQTKKRSNRNLEMTKQILAFITHNYGEDITVQTIAESVGISRSECYRSFKKFTSKSPLEYINDHRLSQASRLLVETTRTISDISMSCGFNSSSYFGKIFKKKYGCTPYAYRKTL
ncbi:AraC family transcriptional regulator [Breznakia pachnodae]|uniref:AraC-like DNA-binding protein n=1 Tax=Breznakia pachnodae TaxID=265178 RepID=A0ABU0E019_9FIRM|nr:AraC family transcriptional regulator [Breznakia pachnodae]MDQ0360243.1 AraC-like DNA-binding protein [Breznakia pachnodae]